MGIQKEEMGILLREGYAKIPCPNRLGKLKNWHTISLQRSDVHIIWYVPISKISKQFPKIPHIFGAHSF